MTVPNGKSLRNANPSGFKMDNPQPSSYSPSQTMEKVQRLDVFGLEWSDIHEEGLRYSLFP